jgi:ADP-ribose pyrophosphatase YjhB (NUDIX family)
MNLNNLIHSDQFHLLNSNENEFVPDIKKNLAYIVGIVLLNDKNEVCLIQEAKQSCFRQWYLPAGRVENNESLIDAAKREAKEETGFEIEPICLIACELNESVNWLRFTFIARITNGYLKTKADKESLCANWFSLDKLTYDNDFLKKLRSKDFIKLVQLGVIYYNLYEIHSFTQLELIKNTSNLILPNSLSKQYTNFTFVLLNENFSKCVLFKNNETDLKPMTVVITNLILNNALKLRLGCFNYVLKNIIFASCFKSYNEKYKVVGIAKIDFKTQISLQGIHIVFVLNVLDELELNLNYEWIQLDKKNSDYFKNEQNFVKFNFN